MDKTATGLDSQASSPSESNALGDPPNKAAEAETETGEEEEETASNTAINAQITDALTIVNATNAAGASVVAVGGLSQVLANATALSMLNAVQVQQNAQTVANAVVAASVRGIMSKLHAGRMP
jgi:hypothetical protein